MNDVTPEILREFLTYDPDTGLLFWKFRDRKWFKDDAACKSWNARFALKQAMASKNSEWYAEGSVLGVRVRAHRVAWAIFYGSWPEGHIDHIDGNKLNNKIENLRSVSPSANNKNAKIRTDNTSGILGVCFDKQTKKWMAKISVSGRSKNLGRFDDIGQAKAARKAAEVKYGFHANHGMR